jgi:hypothetical protein
MIADKHIKESHKLSIIKKKDSDETSLWQKNL